MRGRGGDGADEIKIVKQCRKGSCYFAEYCEMHQVSAGRRKQLVGFTNHIPRARMK
jgi:hypothetical protein